jgi:hypothetical protein
MIWARMLAYITGTVDQELLLRIVLNWLSGLGIVQKSRSDSTHLPSDVRCWWRGIEPL